MSPNFIRIVLFVISIAITIAAALSGSVVPYGTFRFVNIGPWVMTLKWWILPTLCMMLSVVAPGILRRSWSSWPGAVSFAFGLFGLMQLIRVSVLWCAVLLLRAYKTSLPIVTMKRTGWPTIDKRLIRLPDYGYAPPINVAAVVMLICFYLVFWWIVLRTMVRVRPSTLASIMIANIVLQEVIFAFVDPGFLGLSPFAFLISSIGIAYILERSSNAVNANN